MANKPARTGGGRTTGNSARERAAARSRAALAEQRRHRLLMVGVAVAAVVVIVGGLVVAKLVQGSSEPKSGQQATTAAQGVIKDVTSVPPATFEAVGTGTIRTYPKAVDAPALTENGLPHILYVGAEYCPFCASERWPMVVALSRFGTWDGLGQTHSSPSDVYPNTASLTFHGATYSSKYVSFTGKELQSNQVVSGRYAPLDKLSAKEEDVFRTYNAPPYFSQAGAIPFVDLGGRYLISGASYDPTVLQGKSHEQIASALADPNSAIAKAVDGTANVITAAVCELTKGQPGEVCNAPAVKAAATALANAR
jgi:hypothetical protein